MNVLIQCDVCLNDLPLDDFRFSDCGHGFCYKCLRDSRLDQLCGICRQPRRGERQIYMTFAQHSNYAENSRQVSETSTVLEEENKPAVSFRRAIKLVKEQTKKLDKGASEIVLGAISSLESLQCQFSTSELEMKAEITRVKKERNSAKQKLKALEKTANNAKQKYKASEAVRKVEASDAKANRAELERSLTLISKLRKTMNSNEMNARKLENQLDECNKEKNVMKKKLRALAKQSCTRRTQDPDDSLQVMPPKARVVQMSDMDTMIYGSKFLSRKGKM